MTITVSRTDERYTPEEIWRADGGILTLGEDELRGLVSVALAKVPKKVANKVFTGCLFVMAKYEWGRGTFIPKELLKNKCVIALSERLMDKDRESAERTILHEVAHFYLGHMPPGLVPGCSEDLEAQLENEADQQVDEWLNAFWKKANRRTTRHKRESRRVLQRAYLR
jgi:hypothetical protein